MLESKHPSLHKPPATPAKLSEALLSLESQEVASRTEIVSTDSLCMPMHGNPLWIRVLLLWNHLIKSFSKVGNKYHCYMLVYILTPTGPRVFQWKNGQNYPLLKNTCNYSFNHFLLLLTVGS
jgi:hypothetical protein